MTSTPGTEAKPRCGPTADEIRDQVLPQYALPPALRCRFLVSGLHDNYLVEGPIEKYIVRVYRRRWRSREEILFELELLDHLRRRGSPVAYPLLTTASAPLVSVQTADGNGWRCCSPTRRVARRLTASNPDSARRSVK